MIDPKDLQFPCRCEVFNGQRWVDAVCMGLLQEGNAMNPIKNLVVFWLIINNDGIPEKKYKLDHVRFTILSNTTT